MNRREIAEAQKLSDQTNNQLAPLEAVFPETPADLTFNEIEQVFQNWRRQAVDAGEKSAQLWNCLISDLRMLAEGKE